MEKKFASLSSRDWYRVRRGEDEIAWGRYKTLDGIPGLWVSDRVTHELELLDDKRRKAVLERISMIASDPLGQHSKPLVGAGDRWVSFFDDLRIIYRFEPEDEVVHLSTIRELLD